MIDRIQPLQEPRTYSRPIAMFPVSASTPRAMMLGYVLHIERLSFGSYAAGYTWMKEN